MQKNLSLFLLSILLFITSCSQDDIVENNLIEQKVETTSGFYSFSKNSTLQSRNGNSNFSVAIKYSYLLQRYDSIHKTNLSGLVNTTNSVEYNHKLKQNFITEANSFYIETRIFSQVIEE